MGPVIRFLAVVALVLCGWIAADGLRRADAGTGLGLSRARIPWDANRLPESATDAQVLTLRPVSPFARFRDVLSRADREGPRSGEDFRLAARGVLHWGRNQPGTLLDLGRVALDRGLRRGERETQALGEDLLREFVVRTTPAEGEAVRTWIGLTAASDDAYVVWSRVPPQFWGLVGAELAATHPEDAWRFLAPDLERGTLHPAYAGPVLDLARKRRQPTDLAVLRTLAARPDVAPGTADGIRALIAELAGLR